MPGWSSDRHAEALPALRRSCKALPDRSPKLPQTNRAASNVWPGMCRALAALRNPGHRAARQFFEHWFQPYEVSGRDGRTGIFTGYYEPQLRGARKPDKTYRFPLYKRPRDLVSVDLGRFRDQMKGERIAGKVVAGRLVPYPDRHLIARGALDNRGLELLWVDSATDAFFLHIQGSGRVAMADGGIVRVGYADSNGQPYRAIGRDLIKNGEIPSDRISMQTIRAWLAAHPGRARAMMERNKSYIFFRALEGDGPIGAMGVALVPGRSLAVDRRFIPLGLPIWLDTTDPLSATTPLRRLMVAQDTGGAIRGPVRGDVFWGHGGDAAARAGHMKSLGRYFLLLPRRAVPRTS
jgi:membrane-bound lytic murein transglycosylase A